ncbi:hypothetical protein LPJ78_000554 [Coemansia sp. RSA 989]|nr:hypothetical protein LPJ68_002606 [Coemansia sp. RSA 1086]KAJ1753027.1 hypothetical protein LPJ79_000667 [Coemansia sp. RSA 1821]KAJ1868057.1 hypothetical protein LPJ78_000554 [Coemansia sp. RSA 989]KAJ1875409.1 hypothetical protein LPJ55_000765 [Coemansia sp. RSA 990]KAJ2633886.1 hypothetical protein H4R22_000161 [Coemansia sp. RSA 1290]KAJ2651540.1 hypothetical protein IWW40_001731 [Coemansia sp. RSA 1250]KAJ2674232.1 hypothetical protein IWW42_001732 [Coemansia sp. RSA 1085]
MEVIDRQQALLTNYEALVVLTEDDEQQQQQQKQHHEKVPENVTTLKFEAITYLKEMPCASQTPEQIAKLKTELAAYELTTAEILQIIDLRPKSLVELFVIVEEIGERYTEEEMEQMVAIIREILVCNEPQENDSMEVDGTD